MENISSKKLNLLELESLRSELIEKTLNTSSNNLRLFLYQNYFERILPLNNSNLEEAFLKEFLDDYLHCINKYEVWGNDPSVTKKLFEHLNDMGEHSFAAEHNTVLGKEIKRIEFQWIKLTSILNGDDFEDREIHKAFFPLIDNEAPGDFYGEVESVTVRISKNADVDKFIIVPSEKEIERRILEQCRNSWLVALNISKQYVKKPYKNHEVIISFDKKEGFYEGNSLGIALTLSFLEEILKFYNPTYVIQLIEKSAFTGGVTESGEILNTSENIIKRKVSAIFFSQINSFVIPKPEETYAVFTLDQLKKNYPNRKLKIIPTEDINDVLNRRDLVDIRKQKAVVRTAKFVKKNWDIASLIIIILGIIYFANLWDFDTNPSKLVHKGRFLYVMNKNEKVLWKKFMYYDAVTGKGSGMLRISAKLSDIDSDGTNEVIVANEADTVKSNYGNCITRITCYNNDGDTVWTYLFKDKISTKIKEFSDHYWPNIIDIVKEGDKNVLYCFAYHNQYYPGSIFKLDSREGERLDGTFWHPGRIADAYIGEFNGDGNLKIVATGVHNGFESNFIFSLDLKNIEGTAPSTSGYKFLDKEIASFNSYVLIPITDLAKYNEFRYSNILIGSLIFDRAKNSFRITTGEAQGNNTATMNYVFDNKLNVIDIDCADAMQTMRDSLVAKGILKQPYTNSPKYFNYLKAQFRFWDGERFIPIVEINE